MRECEDAMMEDTASRRGYVPTAAWDEGNMIQLTGDGMHEQSDDSMAVRRRMNTRIGTPPRPPPQLTPLLSFTGTVSSYVLTPSQHLGTRAVQGL